MDSSPTPQPAGEPSSSAWEREGRNEKAMRVYNGQLDLLCDAFDVRPEHRDHLYRTVGIIFASDQLVEIDRCISEWEDYRARCEATLEEEAQEWSPSDLKAQVKKARKQLKETRALREEWASSKWAYCHDADVKGVLVGIACESEPEESYRLGFTAELGHAVCELVRGDGLQLDKGVSEFYDVAAQLVHQTSPRPDDDDDGLAQRCENMIADTYFARLYTDYTARCGSFDETVALLAREDVCGKVSDEEFSARCADAGFMGEYEKRCSYVAEMLSLYARDKPEHVAGKRIAHDLRTEAAKQSGLRLEESLPLLVLIAGKALYDPDVDFSSEEGFVRTVKERLQDYLA